MSIVQLGAAPDPFPLTNDGNLELTFVGAGGAFTKKFHQNNLLVVKGRDHLLIDCGTRAPEALALHGLSVGAVANYLITHTHADHIGGLEEVMLVNRYNFKKRPTMVATKRLAEILWAMSLRGGAAYNESRRGKSLEFKDFWDLVAPRRIRGADREMAEARIGGITVRVFRTKHIPDSSKDWSSSFPSYGVIIDGRVLYTSDTRYDPEMVASLDREYGFEAIFHDCQFFTGGVHASLDELAGLPGHIRARTRLMHYGDAIEAQAGRIAEFGFAGYAEEWRSYSLPS
jgi:ribonuclease BN (tRNA processing enzyme)